MSGSPAVDPERPSPAERELVLLGARRRLDEAQRQRMAQLLAGPIDWDRLIAWADFNKILPGLHRWILEIAPGAIPPEVSRMRLDGWMRFIRDRNRAFAEELDQITTLTDAAGIDLLVFKGPLLAMVYGDPSLRDFGDLDIAVSPDRFDALDSVLTRRGYERIPALDAARDRVFRRIHFAYLYRRRPEGCAWTYEIDAHWTLLPVGWHSGLADAAFFARAEPLPGRRHAKRLSNDDVALYLPFHGAKDAWKRLRMVADLAYWIDAHPELDWTAIVARAEATGSHHVLHLGLLLAHALFDVTLPGTVVARARADATAMTLASALVARLQSGERSDLSPFGLSRFHVRVLARPLDRVRYVLSATMTPEPRHLRMVRLPPALTWLYVPLKLVHDFLVWPLWRRLPAGFRSRLRPRDHADPAA